MQKSNLLDLIGHAEMEKEIQKTVTEIIESQDDLDVYREVGIELDEKELKRWYESLEYREILQHRLKAAACDTLMVKGLDN